MANQADVKAKLDTLLANVAAEGTVIGSMETLLTNLAKIIADLKAAALAADVPKALVDQIDAAQIAVDANKTRIANDVTANTPAA